MPASKFWYVGMYLKSKGRFVKKSTRCELLNDAKEFAKDWYEDRILERRTYRDVGVQSFRAFSERFRAHLLPGRRHHANNYRENAGAIIHH